MFSAIKYTYKRYVLPFNCLPSQWRFDNSLGGKVRTPGKVNRPFSQMAAYYSFVCNYISLAKLV